MTALALGHRCALDEPDEHFYDHGLATNTIQRLQFAGKKLASDGTPFFIQSGFARPHTPWRVPSRFWDLYDTEDIVLAEHKLPPADMPGVAWQAHSFFNSTTGAIFPLAPTQPLADDVQKLARHAYMAAVSWMDHQAGRILDELDSLGLTRTTICVLHGGPPRAPSLRPAQLLKDCALADHGWQLGEHNSWHKYTNFVRFNAFRSPRAPPTNGRVLCRNWACASRSLSARPWSPRTRSAP